MRRFSRGAAALILATTLAAAAVAQTPGTPPASPPGTPATPPGMPVGASAVIPSVTPSTKPDVRPTGNAATVNNQSIPEVAVYRALRQFPAPQQEMARKEIMAHLIENILIDQYLNAIKVTVEEKEIEAVINELKAELNMVKKDYVKELEAMMLTEAEFRSEVQAQLKWEKFIKQQSTDDKLKQLFESSPDVFDGTMVRARHILMTPGTD